MRRGVVPASLRWRCAFLTRPVIGRSFPARGNGVVAIDVSQPTRGLSPWVLSSTPFAGSARQDAHPSVVLAPPVSCPGGHCRSVRFASHRICGLTGLTARTRPGCDWLAPGDEGSSPGPQSLRPRRPTPRHPEFGRLEISLRQGMRSVREDFLPSGKCGSGFG